MSRSSDKDDARRGAGEGEPEPLAPVGSPSALRGLSRDTLVGKAHAELLEAIGIGKFPVGTRLPAEHELARALGVSRATVRDALGQLQLQGQITRRPGDGTYVTDPGERFVDELDRFEGADEIAREQGLELFPGDRSVETVVADASVASALELPSGSKVHRVTRTMSTTGGPVIHMVDFIPTHLISVDALQDKKRGVIRDLLIESIPDASFVQLEITGQLADADLARRLHLGAGALVLVVDEIVFTEAGSPIELSRNYYNPTRVTLRTHQTRTRRA